MNRYLGIFETLIISAMSLCSCTACAQDINPKNNINEQKDIYGCINKNEYTDIENVDNYAKQDRCVQTVGRILEVNKTSEGTFIDLYPPEGHLSREEDLTLVIFDGPLQGIRNPEELRGEKVYVFGRITTYRGEPQVILRNGEQVERSPFD